MTTATAAASSLPSRLLGAPLLALADLSVRGICRALSKVSRITDGGVFRYPHGPAFLDCWHERSERGGSVILRLGRVEVCADYRNPA